MRGLVLCGLLLSGCAHKALLTEDEARQQVDQLLTLHDEARAKYVLQLQSLEQDKDCERATLLRKAAKQELDEANMRPGDTRSLTVVQMELAQAEKKCLKK